MSLKDLPIKRKLMAITLITSGVVLLLTCSAFFAYEFFTFRQTTARHLSTLGGVIAQNSTAALAFENRDDARDILDSLKVEPHIVSAALYDKNGRLFAQYPAHLPAHSFPAAPANDGFRFEAAYLADFQPVVQGGNKRLGTLYLKADRGAIYERFRLYATIAAAVVVVSALVAYFLSQTLQKQISQPILSLAETAKAISQRRDYSVRAAKQGRDEVGLLTDAFNQMLTQIQEQNQALGQSEERFRLMMATVKDYAFVMLDPAGCVVSWNAGAERIHGYRTDEILGQHFSRFHGGDEVAPGECERILAVTIAEGRFEEEGWRVRKDGTRFWADTVLTALRDESGQLRGFSKVTRDITERKSAQDEIQKLNQDLERRVHERTAQLEEANKELEAFSYSVSHDLRAPLRHVQGYVELLAKHAGDTLNEKCRRYLRVASESVTQMGDLIDNLLAFCRMGRVEVRQSSVDLQKLVQETADGLQPETGGRKILWKHGPLPQVQGDPALLKQVLVNLLSNAVKYTRGRDPAQIQTGVASEVNGEVVIFVRDNGAGFDMKYVDKLFGVFQRLHRAEEFEGTGVGLANARRVINRHGGRIWAEAAVNAGATFYFTLTKSQKG
ncbi:MAG TPA: ATP-binding protein [Candidatus Acidoferrum sp.]|jgi:PAS domain S-box-containing protein|nr:ATP-binding protein [Candidatus Acidoferrum sp.]